MPRIVLIFSALTLLCSTTAFAQTPMPVPESRVDQTQPKHQATREIEMEELGVDGASLKPVESSISGERHAMLARLKLVRKDFTAELLKSVEKF